MAASQEMITALAQLAAATKGLADTTGEEKKEAREFAKELITMNAQAKLQSAMAIEQIRAQQTMDLTKESINALKEISAGALATGQFKSEALDNIIAEQERAAALEAERGEPVYPALGLYGGTLFNRASEVRKDFKEYIESAEENLKSKAISYADISVKKGLLGADSKIVLQSIATIDQQIASIDKAIDFVSNQQQFDPETRRPFPMPFRETELELLDRAKKHKSKLLGLRDLLS